VIPLLLACAAPSTPTHDEGADSEAPPAAAWSATSAAPATCPRGMVQVPSELQPYCIDQYEVWLDEEGRPQSLEGVVPSVAVSFRQAQASCRSVGKRLATVREWEDAADGQPGLGGNLYVYGNTYDGTICADPEAGYAALQPTGSLPGCVSPFGTFDQTGNAWEWADPEVALDARLSLSSWWATRLAEVEGGRLKVVAELGDARFEAAGWSGELGTDEDGLLVLEANAVGPVRAGYLTQTEHLDEPRAWLPIRVEQTAPGTVPVILAVDRDGDPLTDKRGGSHYSGGEEASRIHASNYTHDADFEGSIGFRCASAPAR
jgi:hypothetical protein